MAELLINQWGGIGDDPFLVRANECLDMNGIDIRTTPRKIQAAPAFLGSYATSTAHYNDTLSFVTETIDGGSAIDGVVQSYGSHCYIGTTNIDALVAGADMHITVGSNLNNYDSTTNPEGVRHFFFTYDNSTNPIKIVGYSAGVRALLATVNTSGSASPPDNILNSRTTAVAFAWEGAILFARANKVYEINPSTNILSTGVTTPTQNIGARIILEYGAIIKNIWYMNGQVVILYTVGNNTSITTLSVIVDESAPNGYRYRDNGYIDTTVGEKCLSAAMNNGMIYWVSPSGIFQYSGQSQLVKAYKFSSKAICSYNKGVLLIADDTTFYEYGVNKPGYGLPLTKITSSFPIHGVSPNYIVTFQSGLNQFRLDSTSSSTYRANNYYITAPYTAGQFGVKKDGLGITVGHRFQPLSQYTTTTILASITIGVQTDLMERINSVNYVTVATISDLESSKTDIMLTTIAKALETAGYSSNFGYIRFKITLNSGDPYLPYGSTVFRKTPEVFDFYISHNELQRVF